MKIKRFLTVAGVLILAVFTSSWTALSQTTNPLPPMPPGMLDWMIGISTGQTMGIYSMDANSGPPGFGGSGGGIPQTPQPQTPGVSTPVFIYGVIDLVTVGGGNQSYANGINNSGTVVGYSYDNSYNLHAFLYNNAPMQDISSVTPDITFTIANGINNSGKIVGNGSISSDTFGHALEYSSGSVVDLAPGLSYNCSANAINTSGQVAGYCQKRIVIETPIPQSSSQGSDAFLLSGGVMHDLGTISGFVSSQAYGVNDSSQVVGSSSGYGYNPTHAFIYSGNGPMVDLDSALGGNGYSVAYGINNNGLIVGVAYNAFIYDSVANQFTDLGALGDPNNFSTGSGINNNGMAVGSVYINNTGNYDAFVYPPGGPMQDLNSMIDPASNWTLESANAINDNGQIVGYGISPDGYEHAFLLNPYFTNIYTAFHQFDTDSSVPTDFGYPDKAEYDANGTAYGSDDCAITKDYGCALCSLASMLTSVSGFESMTAAQLNTALTSNPEGSVNAGYRHGCSMYWPAINNITGSVLTRVDSGSIVSASSADQSALDQYLDNHCWGNRYRVILQLEQNGNSQETHYIFVVGKTNGDWIVFDPGWGNAFDKGTSNPDPGLLNSLNGHLNGFRANNADRTFTVTGVETYQLNPSSKGSLSQIAQSPVELLVTDPNGNRVGYDPVADTNVFEIPGSSYSRDFPILDASDDGGGSAGDTNGIKTVSVPAPLGGSYSTELIGTASGSYTFDSSIVWIGNSETDQTTTGTTDVGVITINSVFVITPALITSCSVVSDTFNLSFTAQTNVTYAVQGANSLLSTNWTSLTTVTATSTNMTASVTVFDPNMMFYRVVSQ